MFYRLICILCLALVIESYIKHVDLQCRDNKLKVYSHRRYLERVRKIFHPAPKGFGNDIKPTVENNITNITEQTEREWLRKYPYLSIRDIWEKYTYTGDIKKGAVSGRLMVSKHVKRPNYYKTGTPILNSYEDPEGLIKTKEDIKGIKNACLIARKILDSVHPYIRTGVMIDTIDRHIHKMCDLYNVYPSPLRYKGFPKSVCVSINEIVCHGIPDSNILSTGDFVNVDVTVYVDGYHGDVSETFLVLPDAAYSKDEFGKREAVAIGQFELRKMQQRSLVRKYFRTNRVDDERLAEFQDKISRNLIKKATCKDYYGISKASSDSNLKLSDEYLNKLKSFQSRTKLPKSKLDKIPRHIMPYTNKLLKSAYNATMAGIEACGPWVPFKAIGEAIESVIERDGFYTSPVLVGHGIGKNFHEEPNIQFVRNENNNIMLPGMVFTIEPVIFEKNCDMITWPDGWTIATEDGSRCVASTDYLVIPNVLKYCKGTSIISAEEMKNELQARNDCDKTPNCTMITAMFESNSVNKKGDIYHFSWLCNDDFTNLTHSMGWTTLIKSEYLHKATAGLNILLNVTTQCEVIEELNINGIDSLREIAQTCIKDPDCRFMLSTTNKIKKCKGELGRNITPSPGEFILYKNKSTEQPIRLKYSATNRPISEIYTSGPLTPDNFYNGLAQGSLVRARRILN